MVGGGPSGIRSLHGPRGSRGALRATASTGKGRPGIFRRDDGRADVPGVGEEGRRAAGKGGGAVAAAGRTRHGSGPRMRRTGGTRSVWAGQRATAGGERSGIGRRRYGIPEGASAMPRANARHSEAQSEVTRMPAGDERGPAEAPRRGPSGSPRLWGDGRSSAGGGGPSTPGFRGRWRTRSMRRSRGTGGST